ncbi:hypothetical protein U9M48_029273 [Paspalum notatum var. saurae]|uniref:BHLH domain-containing protein n=1 Tax=Paspalum notatum var. saurae TaxID=547442 RepID=A0AAQ3U2M8_PASNO
MALLEAVVFPQNHHQRLRRCCRSCGASCVLCGNAICIDAAGEVEEGVVIKRGVVVQEDGEQGLVAAPPHGGACCAWAAGAAVTSCWAGGPVPSTLTASSARRPAHQAAARRHRRQSKGGGGVAAKQAARAGSSGVVQAESHRLNHIAVERNRRRQVNAFLAALRGLMPPSYARRGDQASIVGGAITFIKELEHHLQSLQAQRRPGAAAAGGCRGSERFPGFFTFPQYSTAAAAGNSVDGAGSSGSGPTARPGAADVEAAVSEGHATVKVLAPRRPGQQLLRLLLGLQSRGLAAHHLNVTTTADWMVLYTVSLRMGDGCQLSSADDVAAAVHDIIAVAGMDAAEERAIII